MSHKVSVTKSDDGMIFLSGETFPFKDILKKSGTWVPSRKVWIMPPDFDVTILESHSVAPKNRHESVDDDAVEGPRPRLDRSVWDEEISNSDTSHQKFMLIPSTNTFKVRALIAKAGGRWLKETKQWQVPIDFDMSIIPNVDVKAAPAEAVEPRPKRIIHCSFCGAEGHSKNRCLCPHCEIVGHHPPNICPTLNPRWKFLAGSKTSNLKCTCKILSGGVCHNCSFVCCELAIQQEGMSGLCTICSKHGIAHETIP